MKRIPCMLSAVALLGIFSLPVMATTDNASLIEAGKRVSFNQTKGNCLACHMIVGGDMPGNIGPPLIAMKARFPDLATLRAQIADARVINPNTIMPPFGAHGILTEAELDQVAAYIHSL